MQWNTFESCFIFDQWQVLILETNLLKMTKKNENNDNGARHNQSRAPGNVSSLEAKSYKQGQLGRRKLNVVL